MSSNAIFLNESVQFIYCGCGCGKTRPKYDSQGREGKYIRGHTTKGKKFSEIARQNMSKGQTGRKLPDNIKKILSEQKKGQKNPQFGKIKDSITYRALHKYIRKYYPCPEFCQMCNKVPPKDLANITGIYNREFKNWAYFCRICHQKWDNIPERTLRHRWSKK